MAMMEIRNVHKTFRTYAKAGLRPGAHKVVSELPVLQGVDLTVEKAMWWPFWALPAPARPPCCGV